MPNKYHRQNLRMGTNPFARKSNLQKIAETFGPKKKVKKDKKNKTTKRMFANKGGGADMGKMGELKSKLAVAGMKAKDVMGKSTGGLTKEQIEKLKEIMEKRKKDIRKEMIPLNKGGSAKKKKKFPDMSGDGKVTMKDILMARGVIPKKKKTKKKVI
tara:strand:+ start:43 stop:513 length:471 start_codon:yes stop_codon:yes gene_type:complete